jgi:hypothetical protein
MAKAKYPIYMPAFSSHKRNPDAIPGTPTYLNHYHYSSLALPYMRYPI